MAEEASREQPASPAGIDHPPTVLASPTAFDADTLVVEGDTYRHLFRSRRLAVGDRLRVVDGAGRAREGRIDTVDRKRAAIALGGPLASREPGRLVSLWVGTPRPERADWLVEKATELGVDSIHWLATERSRPALRPAKLERLERIARAAVEQCSRAKLPDLATAATFDDLETLDALVGPSGGRAVERIALVPGGESWGDSTSAAPAGVAVAIGPEGGWAPAERERLAAWGYRAVGLGDRLLRVETAALAALARLLS